MGTWERRGVYLGLALVVLLLVGVLARYDVPSKVGTDLAMAIMPPTPTPTATPTPIPTATPIPTSTPNSYSYVGVSVGAIGGTQRYPISIQMGRRLEAYFTIAQQKDVRFWVEDPYGKTIYSPGMVVGTHQFSIQSHTTGVYNLVFDNCFTCAGRSIGLNYRIE